MRPKKRQETPGYVPFPLNLQSTQMLTSEGAGPR